MRLVTYNEYLGYLKPVEVSRLFPTEEELTDVSTTVWSFPVRRSWATHKGDYGGTGPRRFRGPRS